METKADLEFQFLLPDDLSYGHDPVFRKQAQQQKFLGEECQKTQVQHSVPQSENAVKLLVVHIKQEPRAS